MAVQIMIDQVDSCSANVVTHHRKSGCVIIRAFFQIACRSRLHLIVEEANPTREISAPSCISLYEQGNPHVTPFLETVNTTSFSGQEKREGINLNSTRTSHLRE
jgi:hypothetical protein